MIEIDDQAAFLGSIAYLHIQSHGGKVDENCPFCKAFLMKPPVNHDYPLESYRLVILDLDEDNFVQ